MHKANLPIVSNPTCTDILSEVTRDSKLKISIFEMCAGGQVGSGNTCQVARAGAPLVCQGQGGNFYLAGLAGWNLEAACANQRLPMVFTRVARFFEFLELTP